MKLFEMKKGELIVSEEAWGLSPFYKLWKRDKSKDKIRANAEVLYIWYFCDIKSDYLLMDEEDRHTELKKDIVGLSPKWEADALVKDALEYYKKRSITVIQRLYLQSLKSASDIGDYLENTKALLEERDANGKPIYDIAKITTANDKIPRLMGNLKAAYKEVVKEQEDTANKKKGSQSFNLFEDGISFEE